MTQIRLCLKNEISVKYFSGGEVELQSFRIRWKWKSPYAKQIINLLILGSSEEALRDEWLQWNEDLSSLFLILMELKEGSFLSYTLFSRGKALLNLVPVSSFGFSEKQIDETVSYQLSRFAYLHRQDLGFVCETPLAAMSLKLLSPEAVTVLSSFIIPTSLKELCKKFSEFSRECLEDFLAILREAYLLEEENQALSVWEFHDLLFHSRSRAGRHSFPVGGTYPYLNEIPPLPSLKRMPEETSWIPLFKPDLQEVLKKDFSFARVLETRGSIRKQDALPITLQQLGEFLYRTARHKEAITNSKYEAIHRPYPGGGACHELEIYPLVYRCGNFPQGLYFYQPKEHALALIQEWNPDLEEFAIHSAQNIGSENPFQVTLLIAARFGRVSWKYQSIAYSIVLKDTGALMQTMHLVAAAMGFSSYLAEREEPDLFSRIAKTNYYEESAVGEVFLGF